MDDAHNDYRAVERIIAVAGATSSATGTAVNLPLYNSRRPEKFDITIRAAMDLASRQFLPRGLRFAFADKTLLLKWCVILLFTRLSRLLMHNSGPQAILSVTAPTLRSLLSHKLC